MMQYLEHRGGGNPLRSKICPSVKGDVRAIVLYILARPECAVHPSDVIASQSEHKTPLRYVAYTYGKLSLFAVFSRGMPYFIDTKYGSNHRLNSIQVLFPVKIVLYDFRSVGSK